MLDLEFGIELVTPGRVLEENRRVDFVQRVVESRDRRVEHRRNQNLGVEILRGDDVWLTLEEHQNLAIKGSVCFNITMLLM